MGKYNHEINGKCNFRTKNKQSMVGCLQHTTFVSLFERSLHKTTACKKHLQIFNFKTERLWLPEPIYFNHLIIINWMIY